MSLWGNSRATLAITCNSGSPILATMVPNDADIHDEGSVIQILWDRVDNLSTQNTSLQNEINQIRSHIESKPSSGQPAPAPAPAPTPAYDIGYAYPPPWTIQFHRDTNRATLSQEPTSGPSSGQQQTTLPTAPVVARTSTIVEGVISKPGQISSGRISKSPQASVTGHKLSVHPGLKPHFAAGPLTDPSSGHPLYMYARPDAPQFGGVFNPGYVEPRTDDWPGHWAYFSKGKTENSGYGTAEEVAHKTLGGHSKYFPHNTSPTAEQIHRLREKFGRTHLRDVTSGIDICWVPKVDLEKGERVGLMATTNSHDENIAKDDREPTGGNTQYGTVVGNSIKGHTFFSGPSSRRPKETSPLLQTWAALSNAPTDQQLGPHPSNETAENGAQEVNSDNSNDRFERDAVDEGPISVNDADEDTGMQNEQISNNNVVSDSIDNDVEAGMARSGRLVESGPGYEIIEHVERDNVFVGVDKIDRRHEIPERTRGQRASVANTAVSDPGVRASRSQSRAHSEAQNSTASWIEGERRDNPTLKKSHGRKGRQGGRSFEKIAEETEESIRLNGVRPDSKSLRETPLQQSRKSRAYPDHSSDVPRVRKTLPKIGPGRKGSVAPVLYKDAQRRNQMFDEAGNDEGDEGIPSPSPPLYDPDDLDANAGGEGLHSAPGKKNERPGSTRQKRKNSEASLDGRSLQNQTKRSKRHEEESGDEDDDDDETFEKVKQEKVGGKGGKKGGRK